MIAGLGDLARHASTLSVTQTVALAATGLIWSRYSLVITPKNWSLFSVNAFVALTQLIQLGRAIHYYYFSDTDDPTVTEIAHVNMSRAFNETGDAGISIANYTLAPNSTDIF